jgi:hypothetical protein
LGRSWDFAHKRRQVMLNMASISNCFGAQHGHHGQAIHNHHIRDQTVHNQHLYGQAVHNQHLYGQAIHNQHLYGQAVHNQHLHGQALFVRLGLCHYNSGTTIFNIKHL